MCDYIRWKRCVRVAPRQRESAHRRAAPSTTGAVLEKMKLTWRSPFRLTAALWRAFFWFCRGRPVITPEKIRLEREEKCRLCEFRLLEQCTKCDCYIPAKTLLSSEECPDGRWGRLTLRKSSPNP